MSGRLSVLAWALALPLACGRPRDSREARDFERMRQQQRYDPYEASRFFANGAVLQAPPAHTMSRSAAYASPPAAPSLDAGARQFAISCAPCHGAGGFGGGPMAANLAAHRPPSLRSGPVTALTPDQLFAIITNGFGVMPPYGWQQPEPVRWSVVAYVRALGAQPSTADTRADSAEAATLRRTDSLRTAGASLSQIVKQAGVP